MVWISNFCSLSPVSDNPDSLLEEELWLNSYLTWWSFLRASGFIYVSQNLIDPQDSQINLICQPALAFISNIERRYCSCEKAINKLCSGSGKSFDGMVHSGSGVADCSECSDSGSDLCIDESTLASLVSVSCYPVEERVGCCLEADASDSLGFFELWSSAFGGAEGPSSSSSLSCFLLWSLTLSTTSLSMASSSAIKASMRAWYRRFLILDDSGPGKSEYFSIKPAECSVSSLQTSLAPILPLYWKRRGNDEWSDSGRDVVICCFHEPLGRLWRGIHHPCAQGLVQEETHVISQSLDQSGLLSGLGSGPARATSAVSVSLSIRSESDVEEDSWITFSDVSSSG
ncbi:hypothetical protein Tco_0155609 [Tanacetum coccineum]